MSHEKWRNKELGTLLSESWGFGFNINGLTEGMCSGKRDDKNSCPGCPKCQPMEEGEKPDFPDVDGDGDREEPISKASKEKKEKGGSKDDKEDSEEKEDKGSSKVPPQLRKHVEKKKKMDEARLRAYIRKLIQESLKEG